MSVGAPRRRRNEQVTSTDAPAIAEDWRPYRSLATVYRSSAAFELVEALPVARLELARVRDVAAVDDAVALDLVPQPRGEIRPGDFVQGPRSRRRTALPVIDAAAAAADPRRHGCPGKIGSAVLRPRESP